MKLYKHHKGKEKNAKLIGKLYKNGAADSTMRKYFS